MNIRVLTPEESLEYYNKVREENKGFTPHQMSNGLNQFLQQVVKLCTS